MNGKQVGRTARRMLKRPVHRRSARHDPADLRALQQLAPIVTGYLPWSGSSVAPQTALQVCNELALNERRTVVEFGSGVSTLIMAMWAESEQTPIRVTSVDEDDSWIRLMSLKLERFHYVDLSFVHAPLQPYESPSASLQVSRWYDSEALDHVTGPVDMLLVDGPTAYKGEWRFDRWPALPRLVDRLSPTCAVLLDDTGRSGESKVLGSWLDLHPDFVPRPSGPATWLLRGPSWTV